MFKTKEEVIFYLESHLEKNCKTLPESIYIGIRNGYISSTNTTLTEKGAKKKGKG